MMGGQYATTMGRYHTASAMRSAANVYNTPPGMGSPSQCGVIGSRPQDHHRSSSSMFGPTIGLNCKL